MWGISKSLKTLNNPQIMIVKSEQNGPKKRFIQTMPASATNKRPKTIPN